jgi:hypothetical protein
MEGRLFSVYMLLSAPQITVPQSTPFKPIDTMVPQVVCDFAQSLLKPHPEKNNEPPNALSVQSVARATRFHIFIQRTLYKVHIRQPSQPTLSRTSPSLSAFGGAKGPKKPCMYPRAPRFIEEQQNKVFVVLSRGSELAHLSYLAALIFGTHLSRWLQVVPMMGKASTVLPL